MLASEQAAGVVKDPRGRRPRGGKGRRFSPRRITVIRKLRAWQHNPRPVRPERCYSVDALLRLQAQGKLEHGIPDLLAGTIDAASERVIRFRRGVAPFVLSLLGRYCIDQGKEALLGAQPKLAALLRCSLSTLQRALGELADLGMVKPEPRFSYAPGFIGRDGREHTHRELTMAYRPGGTLRTFWGAWRNRKKADQERRERLARRERERERRQRRKLRRQEQAWRADLHARTACESGSIKGGQNYQPSEPRSCSSSGSSGSHGSNREEAVSKGVVDNPGPLPVTTHVTGAQARAFWAAEVGKAAGPPPERPAPAPRAAASLRAGPLVEALRALEGCDGPEVEQARQALQRAGRMPAAQARADAHEAMSWLDVCPVKTEASERARHLVMELLGYLPPGWDEG